MDNLENIFKIANLIQSAILVLNCLISLSDGFLHAFPVLFVMAFAGAIGALEFTDAVAPLCRKYASFLFSFIGRGVFSIFLATLIIPTTVSSFPSVLQGH